MRCTRCIWFDEENKECLIKGIRILRPNLPRRCALYNMVPELAKNYLEGINKVTEIEKHEIVESEPYRNYLRKFRLRPMN